eukprot:5396682-Amphidinium_carterae.1
MCWCTYAVSIGAHAWSHRCTAKQQRVPETETSVVVPLLPVLFPFMSSGIGLQEQLAAKFDLADMDGSGLLVAPEGR